MKTFLTKHQTFIFLVLTFLISWYPWYTGIAPEVMAMGPSIAAFVLVAIISGKKGFGELIRPFGRIKAKFPIWFIALFGTALMYLVGIGVYVLLGGDAPPFIMIREELNLVLVVLMPWNGPVGEEFGWRGYLLPKMQTKYTPLIASLLIGTIWGIWHLPDFFATQGVIPSMVASVGFAFLVPYTLGTIANSIFMTWLYNKTNKSALIAGIIWHAAIDFWAPILLSESSLKAAQAGEGTPTIDPTLYLVVLAVQVFLAVVLVLATKGKLGKE